MKIATTGAGGLFGTAFVALACNAHDVYSLYNQHKPSFGAPVQIDLQHHDRLARVLKEVKPDVIVHAAALTDVDLCEKQRELAMAINYEATRAVVHTAKELDAFVIYMSTDYVFDGERGMYGETDRPNPVNFYGLTKLRGEEVVKEQLTDYLIVRTSVIYGSTPASGKVNFALWILDKLEKRQPVPVLTDQYVSPTLNTNLAELILDAVNSRTTGILHLAGASRVSRYEFAASLCDEWGLDNSLLVKASIREMKWAARRPRDSSLDVSKAKAVLEGEPLTVSESLKALRCEIETRV